MYFFIRSTCWGAPARLVASDLPFTYVSRVEDALHFSTPALATGWLLARGITARATAYLRTDMPDQHHYLIQATRKPEKALTA